MSARFAQLAFTPAVRRLQEKDGSRAHYARAEAAAASPSGSAAPVGPAEAGFIRERDSFYMATVSETGWPYVQHRGGAPGFLKVLDERTIAFADFRGNRQHVSEGNLSADDRVALILVDYPRQERLKLLGRARVTDATEAAEIMKGIAVPRYEAAVERLVVIRIEATEWNCPQHITPRYTAAELEPVLAPLRARIAELEEQLKFASSV